MRTAQEKNDENVDLPRLSRICMKPNCRVPFHGMRWICCKACVVTYKEHVANLCTRCVYMTMTHSIRLHLQGGRGRKINERTGGGRDVVVTYVGRICAGFR